MKIKIDLLPNYFVDEQGVFKSEEAINFCGKIAGVCYSKEGYKALENEDINKTKRRVDLTLNNGHHSVYDHVYINMNIQNIPKALAMLINNENQYTTSEKSARYTKISRGDNKIISEKEEVLYNKWVEIFKEKIKEKYGNVFDDRKILKLAQENARYLVTVFMPTTMIYSTSLRQINYIASWMKEYINTFDPYVGFNSNLAVHMQQFLDELEKKGLLVEGLMKNEKHRNFSMFGQDLDKLNNYYSNIYSITYDASFAYLAQAQRHRTIDYKMELLPEFKCFVPPIIEQDENLKQMWISDMKSVKSKYPQGQLIRINETGTYDNFILKCKERLCSATQLEIMLKTKQLLDEYKMYLEKTNNVLKDDIENYTNGARCTFKDFECSEKCGFKEGICLTRKI